MNSKKIVHYILLALPYAFSGCKEESDNNKQAPANTLFLSLNPSQTNIDFQNTLTEGLNTNILMYEYFYNGGGIAAGDFNKDGLVDLYFSSNMSDNKLYLNKGDFKFEDITDVAKVDGKGEWCRGVAVVDINNDGLQDIYVCATLKNSGNERKNLLYINQGTDKNNVPYFKEMAEEYGLADTGQSTQAAFFACKGSPGRAIQLR